MQNFKEILNFSLQKHIGDYQNWPRKTKLFFNKKETGLSLEGYVINEQLETDYGYLLILDCDCPFEEVLYIYYLNQNFKLISRKIIGFKNFMSIGSPGVYERIFLESKKLIFRFDSEAVCSLELKSKKRLLMNMIIIKK